MAAEQHSKRRKAAKPRRKPRGRPAVRPAELERIARVVHESVRAWAFAHGDKSLPAWEDAEDWMIQSTREAVRFRLDHPDAPASAQHDQWMAERKASGWRYGPVKDPAKKTHPMLVAYARLPLYERRKDALVGAVISSLTEAMGGARVRRERRAVVKRKP